MTALPFVVALVGMVLIGRHSDRTGERKGHVAACAMTGAIGLVLAAGFHDSVPLIVLSFALSQLGQRSVQGVFWAIPPMFLGGTAAAAGIALINSVGNLGGFVGPDGDGMAARRDRVVLGRAAGPGRGAGFRGGAGHDVAVAEGARTEEPPRPGAA